MLIRPLAMCGALSVLLFGLVGCFSSLTTSSSLSNDKLQANLVAGKTTQAEVKQLYGQPTRITNSKSGATWTYVFEPAANGTASVVGSTAANAAIAHGTVAAMSAAHGAGAGAAGIVGTSIASSQATGLVSSAMSANNKTKTLTINFDKAGIVKNYNLD